MSKDTKNLELTLDGETDIIVRRLFNHPPTHVWKALTEPALIRKWMTSQDDMQRCEMNPHPGGTFLYEWKEFSFSGPILESEAPHRMIHVEYFSEDKTYRAEITTTLVAQGASTSMTQVMRYASKEARAAAIKHGFTDSLDVVYDRLEELQIME